MAEWWTLRALSWSDVAKRTWREVWDDEVFAKSARLAFYFFFALFPVLLLLVMLLAEAGTSGSQFRATLLDAFNQVLPANASALVAKTVRQQSAKAVLGTGAVVAGISAVWGALNGTWAIVAALNDAYEVTERRSWGSLLRVIVGLTISLSVLDLIALVIILYGTQAGKIVLAHRGMGGDRGAAAVLLRAALPLRSEYSESALAMEHAGRRHCCHFMGNRYAIATRLPAALRFF